MTRKASSPDVEHSQAKLGRYLPIDSELLKPNTPISFNLYLRYGESFLLYCPKGEALSEDVRTKLLERGVKSLHILREDKEAFDDYLGNNLQNLLEEPSLDDEKKSQIVYMVSVQKIRQLFDQPTCEMIRNSKKVTTNSSRPTWQPAPIAFASCSIRTTVATVIPSSTAPTAGHASPSSTTSLTTAPTPRCASSRSATTAVPNTKTQPIAASTRSRMRVPFVAPKFGWKSVTHHASRIMNQRISESKIQNLW